MAAVMPGRATIPLQELVVNHDLQIDQVDLVRTYASLFPAVPALKRRLGPQAGTFLAGGVRHWFWEGDGWVVFASRRGISFELAADRPPDSAPAAWADFKRRAQLT